MSDMIDKKRVDKRQNLIQEHGNGEEEGQLPDFVITNYYDNEHENEHENERDRRRLMADSAGNINFSGRETDGSIEFSEADESALARS